MKNSITLKDEGLREPNGFQGIRSCWEVGSRGENWRTGREVREVCGQEKEQAYQREWLQKQMGKCLVVRVVGRQRRAFVRVYSASQQSAESGEAAAQEGGEVRSV